MNSALCRIRRLTVSGDFLKGKTMLKKISGVVVSVAPGLMMVSGSAFAVPPDFTALTSGIDLSTVQAAVLTSLVALLGLYLVMGGGKTIIGFFKGGR